MLLNALDWLVYNDFLILNNTFNKQLVIGVSHVNKLVKVIMASMSVSFLYLGLVQAGSDEFPGRAEFSDVPIITSVDFRAKFDEVLVVDVRSSVEFEILRIKGAINIPVASDTFASDLIGLTNIYNKPVVFYCNGRACVKSYIAVVKGRKAGVKNLAAFDAGVFGWSQRYPEQSVLLGKSPVDPRNLISEEKLTSRFLKADTFSYNIADNSKQAIVLDIRDKHQRAGVGFYPGKERWASLENQKKLKKYIAMAKRKNKTLYIYDAVGKQVRGLQYLLEQAGIENYYFMENGATGYYAMIDKLE